MTPEDWPGVRSAYLEGIATGQATFEETAPEEYAAWSASRLATCRLVAHPTGDASDVLGWAALSPVSSRPVYRGVWRDTLLLERRSRLPELNA